MYYLALLWGNISNNSKPLNGLFFLYEHWNFLLLQAHYHNPASFHQTYIYSATWKIWCHRTDFRECHAPIYVITFLILGKWNKTKYRHLRPRIHFSLVLQLLHFLLYLCLSETHPVQKVLYKETLTRSFWGVCMHARMYVYVCTSISESPRFHLEQVFLYIDFLKNPDVLGLIRHSPENRVLPELYFPHISSEILFWACSRFGTSATATWKTSSSKLTVL